METFISNPISPALPTEIAIWFPGRERMNVQLEWEKLKRSSQILTLPNATNDRTQAWSNEPHKHTTVLWRSLKQTTPLLSDFAARILSVRLGIAEVERAFSKLRQLEDVHRSSASADTVEAEFFCIANGKFLDQYS